jgi:SulP family sulfate permease
MSALVPAPDTSAESENNEDSAMPSIVIQDEKPIAPAVLESGGCPEPEKGGGHAQIAETSKNGKEKETVYEMVFREVLTGITIGCAQIPESVAFAYMAHIKPAIALHAAWMVGLCCSLFGGRPGMVNGATGAFAAIIGTFIPEGGIGENGEGIETLFPSVMLAGVLMLLSSFFDFHRFILLLPQSVITGFCNGLAIVIGMAQLHPFKDSKTHHWKTGPEMYWMLITCLLAMATMEFLPKLPYKIFKKVPSSFLAIVVAVMLEFVLIRPAQLVTRPFDPEHPCIDRMGDLCLGTNTIRDVSEFTEDTRFPIPFFMPYKSIVYDLQALKQGSAIVQIIIQGILLCIVGSIESLLTSEVVEAFIKTPSDGKRTLLAMGVGNVLSGFFGGMGGNAMIGLSTVNCLNGGKNRIGPTVTAIVVLVAIVGAYPALNYIPVSALSGIMIVVVLKTFKWSSLRMLLAQFLPRTLQEKLGCHRTVPGYEIVTIFAVTVVANVPKGTNIAYAVGVGVAISAIGHTWFSAHAFDLTTEEKGSRKVYNIRGPLFNTFANKIQKLFSPSTDPKVVEINFAYPTALDFTGMHVLREVAKAYAEHGKQVLLRVREPNEAMWEPAEDAMCLLGKEPLKIVGDVEIKPF